MDVLEDKSRGLVVGQRPDWSLIYMHTTATYWDFAAWVDE